MAYRKTGLLRLFALGFFMSFICFLANTVNLHAQEPDADKSDQSTSGIRLSLEVNSFDLKTTFVPPESTDTVELDNQYSGRMLGVEYTMVNNRYRLQGSLGVFFSLGFLGGSLDGSSFYAPLTYGTWIDLGSRFRVNASLNVTLSSFNTREDSLNQSTRQDAMSIGPVIGLSYLLSPEMPDRRLELNLGASHYVLRSNVLIDDGQLMEIDADSELIEFYQLRLSYVGMLP